MIHSMKIIAAQSSGRDISLLKSFPQLLIKDNVPFSSSNRDCVKCKICLQRGHWTFECMRRPTKVQGPLLTHHKSFLSCYLYDDCKYLKFSDSSDEEVSPANYFDSDSKFDAMCDAIGSAKIGSKLSSSKTPGWEPSLRAVRLA